MAAIKINNAFENQVDLMKKLTTIKIKKKWDINCINNIQSGNWFEVFRNLIYRIEYYSELKVLSYTKQDLNVISTFIKQNPKNLEVMAEQLVDKAFADDEPVLPADVASKYVPSANTKTFEECDFTEKQILLRALELEAKEQYIKTKSIEHSLTYKQMKDAFDIDVDYLSDEQMYFIRAGHNIDPDFQFDEYEETSQVFYDLLMARYGASIVSEDTPQAVAASLKNQVDPNFIRDVDEYVNQIYTAAIINGAYETLYKSAKLGEVTTDYAEQVVSLNASTLIKPTAEIRIVAQIYDDYIAWCVKTVLEMLKQYPKIVMYSGGEVL